MMKTVLWLSQFNWNLCHCIFSYYYICWHWLAYCYCTMVFLYCFY